jgi:hypothetical protein
MGAEQAAKLALADAEAIGQGLDILLVERAEFDQRQGARDRVRRAAPGAKIGRRLRPAAQAGAKAGLLRSRGGGVERDVLRQRRARRTDRTAIDAGRLHADEQSSVEPGVALQERAVAGVMIKIHALDMGARGALV